MFVKNRRGSRLSGEPGVQQVEVKVVRDQPGVAWVQLRVGGRHWICMGACYLPPKASIYYQQEGGGKGQEGRLSADRHCWALGEAVLEFSQRGEVLLVGDLNCRLGGRQGDGGLGLGAVGRRYSRDPTWDGATGGRLENLCEETGMVVLNGRLPRNEKGAHTFFSRTGRDRSVIDNAVSSPGLVFQQDGRVRKGTKLEVWPAPKRASRVSGSLYDHQPVTLTVMLQGRERDGGRRVQVGRQGGVRGDGAGSGSGREVVRRLRWCESLGELYLKALDQDEEVRDTIRGVEGAVGVEAAAGMLEEAIRMAAEQADRQAAVTAGFKEG